MELFTLVENALLLAYMKRPAPRRALVPSYFHRRVRHSGSTIEDNQKIDRVRHEQLPYRAATVRQVLSQRLH